MMTDEEGQDGDLDISEEAQEQRIAAMAVRLETAGVETVSELHELHGTPVKIGDTQADGSVKWLDAVIDYAVDDRFRATTEPAEVTIRTWDPARRRFVKIKRMDHRSVWGLLVNLEDRGGVLHYVTRQLLTPDSPLYVAPAPAGEG